MIRPAGPCPVVIAVAATAVVTALFAGDPALAHPGHGDLLPHSHPHGTEQSLAGVVPYGLGIALSIAAVGLVLAWRARRAVARARVTAPERAGHRPHRWRIGRRR